MSEEEHSMVQNWKFWSELQKLTIKEYAALILDIDPVHLASSSKGNFFAGLEESYEAYQIYCLKEGEEIEAFLSRSLEVEKNQPVETLKLKEVVTKKTQYFEGKLSENFKKYMFFQPKINSSNLKYLSTEKALKSTFYTLAIYALKSEIEKGSSIRGKPISMNTHISQLVEQQWAKSLIKIMYAKNDLDTLADVEKLLCEHARQHELYKFGKAYQFYN